MSEGRLLYAVLPAAQHRWPGHHECPERVTAIQAALQRLGVFSGCAENGQATQLAGFPPQPPPSVLEAVHTAAHVERLRATSASVEGPTAVRDPDDPDGPTFATPTSFADALLAASAACALLDAVVASSSSSSGGAAPAAASAFCICRPPGHHATADDQMGFCLLNNAALAARHAQRAHGLHKVLILDWDVHHGNGTQHIFYSDPSVLFVDLHQADVWPGSGAAAEAGEGPGVGATINVPLPWHSGHGAAQRAFREVVAPAARRFGPDIIIVSAGYDAHWRDPLEHLQWQSGTYHWLATAVRGLAAELCGGRLLMLLEGGYNQEALGESAADTTLALLGKPSAFPLMDDGQLPHPEPAADVAAALQAVRRLHGLEAA